MAKDKKVFAFIDKDKKVENNIDIDEFVSSATGQKKTLRNLKGRPEIPEHKKKKHYVMVYLTEEQKKELMNKAETNNLSLSKYIAIKLFGID